MANNSYGWVQPQSQPAIPMSPRFAPPPNTMGKASFASATPVSNAGMGNGQFQGQGFDHGDNTPPPPVQPPRTYVGAESGQPGGYSGSYTPYEYTPNFQQGILPTSDMLNPSRWEGDFAGSRGSYMNNFYVPYVNAQNAIEAQRFNEYNANQNFGEQQFVNRGQMDLAQQGQNLQNRAFDFSSGAQFQQGIKQFDAQQKLAQQTQNQTSQYQMGQNAYNAANVANQYALGQQQNKNTAMGMNQQYDLGLGQNAYNAANVRNQYSLGQQQNANQLTGLNQQYDLGKVQNANATQANQNQLYNYQKQYELGQGANSNQLLGLQNQMTLGQGQLGYQNRQLDTTNAFNQQELKTNAQLAREKYANDAMQARYAAFGRAQAPNTRSLMSWK